MTAQQDRPIRVLLVEDNPKDTRLLQETIAHAALPQAMLIPVRRLNDALARLAAEPVDALLLDLFLPDSQGLETFVALHAQAPDVPIVVLTSLDQEAFALEALQQGAQDYLVKELVDPAMVSRVIRHALAWRQAEAAIRNAQAYAEQVLSSIPSILIGVDLGGCITYWNAASEAIFGILAAEVMSRPLARCEIPWDAARVLAAIEECRATDCLVQVEEVSFQRRDRSEGVLELRITPLPPTQEPWPQQGDAWPRLLLFGTEITTSRQTASALEQSRRELAREHALLKGLFEDLRSTTHELEDQRRAVQEADQRLQRATSVDLARLTETRRMR